MKNPGSQVFGIYAPVYGTTRGVWTNEFDTFNYVADAPNLYPWSRALGTFDNVGVAMTCAFGGPI